MRRPPRAHLRPLGRGTAANLGATAAAAGSVPAHAGPAPAARTAPQVAREPDLAPGGPAHAALELVQAHSGPAWPAPSKPELAVEVGAPAAGAGGAAQALGAPDLAAGAVAVTPAAGARPGRSSAAHAASLAMPATCASQGLLGFVDPNPGPAGARGPPGPCVMTPATGCRRGGGPASDPYPTPGSAATPAPRLTVQFLPADAAAAARVAAAGGNPHLELDCKCAAPVI